MANTKQTLVQRIALDGGADIEKELKDIGAEGEATFKKLKEGADNLAKSSTGVNAFFTKLRSDLTTIGTGATKVRQGFDDISKGITEVVRNVTILTGVVAAAGLGLEKLAESGADAADSQNKAAQAAGLSMDEFGKLAFAFKQGDVAQDSFQVGMKKFNTVLDQASKGGKTATDLFTSLGVSVLGADGKLRPTSDILADVADAFNKLPNGAIKSADALQLFGKSGAQFVPVLNEGGAALKAFGQEAVNAGAVFTEQQAVIGEAFKQSLNQLTATVTGLKNQIGLTLAPAFTQAFSVITTLIQDNHANILAFAASITSVVIPVIKDFANALAGNDSAVVNKNILTIRDDFEKVGQAVLFVISILQTVFTVLQNTIQPIVDVYNATLGNIFGKIDSQTALITIALFALTGAFKGVGLAIKGTELIFSGLELIFGTTTAQIAAVIARVLLLQGLLKTLVQDMVTSFGDALTAVEAAFSGAVTAIEKFFAGLGSNVGGVIDAISNALQAVISLAQKAAAAVAGALGGGGGSSQDNGQGFASGGAVRGPGTGTSDSILARLSNGEFVMRAAAVRRLGVNFLNSLNAGKSAGFNLGGLVDGIRSNSLPGFAAGGLVAAAGGGRTPITLNIGGETFADLLAPVDVADKLVQYAMGQKVRSGGKKPSWRK